MFMKNRRVELNILTGVKEFPSSEVILAGTGVRGRV